MPQAQPAELDSIRVVLDNNYPPYTFLDADGNSRGISIDLWRLWEKKTGIPVKITALDWNVAQERMQAGEFDVIDTLFYNENRAKLYSFSKPYARLDVPIFFLNTISGIDDASSLKGFPVAAKSGDIAVDFLQQAGVEQILEYPSYEAIIQAAQAKDIIVFLIDQPPALYFLHRYGLSDQFQQSRPLYSGEFHRAVLKGNDAILAAVEQGFAMISAEETAAINTKWLGQPANAGWNWQWVWGVVAFAAVLIVVLFGWGYSLRSTVARRTADLNQTLQELAANEKRFAQLMTNIPGIVFRCANDTAMTILYISDAIHDLLGHPANEFLNQPVAKLLSQARSSDPQRILDAVRIDLAATNRFTVDFPILNAVDKEMWVTIHGQGVTDDSGRLAWIDGVAVNITPRVKAENALRESEEKLRSIIESMDDLVFVFDDQGRILQATFANDQRRLFRSAEVIEGKRLDELEFPEDVVTSFHRAFNIVRDEGTAWGFDYSLHMPDGVHWYSARTSRRLHAGGQFAGVTMVVRDITARKQVEETLHRHEQESRRLSDLMAALTRISMALSQVQNTDDLFRLAVEMGIRQLAFDRLGIWLADEEDKNYCRGTYGVDETGQIRDEQHRRLKIDLANLQHKLTGLQRPVNYAQNVPLFNDCGEVVGVGELAQAAIWDEQEVIGYISVDNLFQRQPIDPQQLEALSVFAQVVGQQYAIKKGQEALLHLNAELEQRVTQRTAQLENSYAEMQSFSYSISHDLRAPVRSLNSFSQILSEEYGDRLDEEGRDYLRRIRAAGTHLTNLIDALLKLARISRSDLTQVNVALDRIAQEIADSLTAAQPERKVNWQIMPALHCQVDPVLIRVALENLIGNAWKFTAHHTESHIEIGKIEQAGETVFYVRDDGAGFDMRYAEKLFGAFQRLHLASEFEGTGIGLAIVQRIINRHHGRIWAESAVEQGATFYFTLG